MKNQEWSCSSFFIRHSTFFIRSSWPMFEYVIFFFFAAVAVIFALVVITNRNPVVGALSLVVSFFALAVMYVLLDAPFLAALQVIVYAAAIVGALLLSARAIPVRQDEVSS